MMPYTSPLASQTGNGPYLILDQLLNGIMGAGIGSYSNDVPPENENGHDFAKREDELLSQEIFATLQEAKVLIEQRRMEYNQLRPHSALGYRPPAPEAVLAAITT